MKAKDIKIGEFYRVQDNKLIYAKALKVMPPKTAENKSNSILVECYCVLNKDDTCGLVKYFKVSRLVKLKE